MQIELPTVSAYLVPVNSPLERLALTPEKVTEEISELLGTSPDDVTTLPLALSTVYMSRKAQTSDEAAPNQAATFGISKATGISISVRGPVIVIYDEQKLAAQQNVRKSTSTLDGWLRNHRITSLKTKRSN